MTTNEILILVSIIVTIITGIIGFGFTIYQIKKSNKVKHAEFVSDLLKSIRLNERIILATYLIDYNEDWYNYSFHGGSETEKNIDALFSQLDYICYLHKELLLDDKDFSIFKYELNRVCKNSQCQSYLWNLYHWSKNDCAYNNLIEYMRKQFNKTEFEKFESKEKLISGYKKYLNF